MHEEADRDFAVQQTTAAGKADPTVDFFEQSSRATLADRLTNDVRQRETERGGEVFRVQTFDKAEP